MEQLKPCPFCGGTETVTMARAHAIKGRKYVECVTCTAIGPDADTMEEAVEAWNRRIVIPSAPVRELVAAAQAVLAKVPLAQFPRPDEVAAMNALESRVAAVEEALK